ncbi:MAG: uroporphyrinogen decarboxylase family protein [Anaerolineae bacterium]|nr:uroporphyrinogen decarboxylase family protein [Anaerolineae bacterium]
MTITSLQRVLTTLSHQEPDRVPFFLLVTLHGAKELGLSIREYLSHPANVVEGQLRLRAKYHHDCLVGFCYTPIEVEAWGGEVIFRDDGPPNSGEPFIRTPDDIKALTPPDIRTTPCLQRTLEIVARLKEKANGEVPVAGVVISPFSLPVMQMGFEKYLILMYEQPALFERLMAVNEAFCVAWAKAQLAAGATFIGYFDPVSSPTIIPRDLYLKTGFPIAQRTLAQINGPSAIHMASASTQAILDDVARTGAIVIGVSSHEDLAVLKAIARGKLTLLGNLNGIEMRRWTPQQAEQQVKDAIAKAGPGGGFILADHHGEIPWQVPDEVLFAIAEAVERWGHYPLKWAQA